MSWEEFADIAYNRFRKGCDEVLMGYKLVGDSGGVTELALESEWKNAMTRIVKHLCWRCFCLT